MIARTVSSSKYVNVKTSSIFEVEDFSACVCGSCNPDRVVSSRSGRITVSHEAQEVAETARLNGFKRRSWEVQWQQQKNRIGMQQVELL